LHSIKRGESLGQPLTKAIGDVLDTIETCSECGNMDTTDPCPLCTDPKRDAGLICVVEDVADLWALERAKVFQGRYHVLGGVLSALDGIGPEDLNIPVLFERIKANEIREVILATSATVDGQTTAHYLTDLLAGAGVEISELAHGVPVGGELDYLDDGTLSTALKDRRPV
ncbi:MAG: recombination protein RecR, partial [Alphaproteobacteria bacterium]|nr:recombination protein RecR [Alphaproteobacteria bacterium]